VVTAPFIADRHQPPGPPVLELPRIKLLGQAEGQEETKGGKRERRVVETVTPGRSRARPE